MPNIIGEDENSYTLQQDDGSQTRIAKAGLSPAMNQKIVNFQPTSDPTVSTAPNPLLAASFAMPPQSATDVPSALSTPAPGELSAPSPTYQPPVNQSAPTQFAMTPPHVGAITQSTHTIEQSPEGKKANDTIVKGIQAQEAAEKNLVDAQVNKQKGLELLNYENSQKLDFQAAQNAKNEAARQASLQDGLTSYQSAQDAAKNFKFTGFWDDKDTGQKVLGAIGLVLSGIGSAMTGQQNMAMKIIDQAAQDHVMQQKMQYGKLADTAAGAQTAYGMLRQKLGDERVADAATMENTYKQIANRVQNYTDSSNSPIIKANGQVILAQLQQKIGEVQGQAAKHIENNVTTQFNPGIPMAIDPNSGQVIMPNFKDVKELQDYRNSNPEMKNYEADRAQLEKTERLGKSIYTNPQLVANLMESSVPRGRFTPEFAEFEKSYSLADNKAEWFRKIKNGGENPKLIAALTATIRNQAADSEQRALPVRNFLMQQARSLKQDPYVAVGGMTQKELEQQREQKLGIKNVSTSGGQ